MNNVFTVPLSNNKLHSCFQELSYEFTVTWKKLQETIGPV